jgi:AraC-like DNA-binding protein
MMLIRIAQHSIAQPRSLFVYAYDAFAHHKSRRERDSSDVTLKRTVHKNRRKKQVRIADGFQGGPSLCGRYGDHQFRINGSHLKSSLPDVRETNFKCERGHSSRAVWAGLGKNCYALAMTLTVSPLAEGCGWAVADVVCTAGPNDRPFEEQHERVAVAAVIRGAFRYRTRQGAATLAPGALMLGNPGACFECGHEHGVGDRCLSFHFERGWFEGVVASTPGARRATFTAPRIAPSNASVRLLAAAEAAIGDARAVEEIAVLIAGFVVSQPGVSVRPASARDEKRIGATIRLLEADGEEAPTLAKLAAAAGMSPFHFLRTFRAVSGATPYQFILGQRLRRAAARLRRSPDPIAVIAFESGFGDLSTFNRRFRRLLGMTPSAWRRGG